MADSDAELVSYRADDSDGEVTFPRFEDMDQWRAPFANQMGPIGPGQGSTTGDESQTEGEPESEDDEAETVKADSQTEIDNIRSELRRSAERFERENSVMCSTPIISVKDPDADVDESLTSKRVRIENFACSNVEGAQRLPGFGDSFMRGNAGLSNRDNLGSSESRFFEIESRLSGLELRMDQVQQQIDGLPARFAYLDNKIDAYHQQMQQMGQRIDQDNT